LRENAYSLAAGELYRGAREIKVVLRAARPRDVFPLASVAASDYNPVFGEP
jgi:hypothetical protein